MTGTRITAAVMAVLSAAVMTAYSYAAPPDIAERDRIDITEAQHTPEEDAEIDALARMLYGEARGVASTTEKAACVWVVLNRVSDDRWPDTAEACLSQPMQFSGYDPDYPIDTELRELAADVYDRWAAERLGASDVGRVIPENYYYWRGDGKRNWFRSGYGDRNTWDWTLTSPYND